jgi:hypothetical protein
MRQSSNGRDTVQTGSDTYAVGGRVCGAIDGLPGTVVAVSRTAAGYPIVSVVWDGADAPVNYPADYIMIRRTWPWE